MRRRGHSIPELLVTLAFLGTALAAVAAAGAGALRATGEAVLRQGALVAAAAALDSVLASADPASGSAGGPGFRLHWTVGDPGRGRTVRVRVLATGSRRELAVLRGFWIAPPPVAWPETP